MAEDLMLSFRKFTIKMKILYLLSQKIYFFKTKKFLNLIIL